MADMAGSELLWWSFYGGVHMIAMVGITIAMVGSYPYAVFALLFFVAYDPLTSLAVRAMKALAILWKRVKASTKHLVGRPTFQADDIHKSQSPRKLAAPVVQQHTQVVQTEETSPLQPGARVVTEGDVKLHSRADDCWVMLYGEAYDVTEYMHLHPGRDFLVQVAGKDGTGLFESIHPSRVKDLLNSDGFRSRYHVGHVERARGEAAFNFDDPFYKEVSAGVDAYFKAVAGTCWARGGLVEMATVYTKFLLVICFVGYTKWCTLSGAGLFFSVLHGLGALVLIFNVTHGACHGELVKNYPAWLTTVAQMAHMFLGCRPEEWKSWHNVSHHQHTNTQDDDDMNESGRWFRMHSHHRYFPHMRFQHLYIWFIYPLAHLVAFVARDKRCSSMYLLASNLLSWALCGQTCMLALLVQSFTFGMGFVLINHITHANNETDYVHKPNETLGWGEHQLRSSGNWCMDSVVITHLFGGINYQIEHHLFQSVHHTHYPALSKIVRKVAEQRNIPYVLFPTYLSALRSHVRLLVRLGASQ